MKVNGFTIQDNSQIFKIKIDFSAAYCILLSCIWAHVPTYIQLIIIFGQKFDFENLMFLYRLARNGVGYIFGDILGNFQADENFLMER